MLSKNTSIESCDSGIAGELPPRLEALARASKQSSLSRGKYTCGNNFSCIHCINDLTSHLPRSDC